MMTSMLYPVEGFGRQIPDNTDLTDDTTENFGVEGKYLRISQKSSCQLMKFSKEIKMVLQNLIKFLQDK